MSRRSKAFVDSLEGRRLLAAVTWDGGGSSTSWADPLNWSNNALPTAADDVTVNGSYQISQDVDAAVRSLTVDGQATVTLQKVLTVGTEVRVKNTGTITSVTGDVTGTGKIIVDAGGTWAAKEQGSYVSAGNIHLPVDNYGTLNLSAGQVTGPAVHNYATARLIKGSVSSAGFGGAFYNEAGATLIAAPRPINPASVTLGLQRAADGSLSPAAFVNKGTVILASYDGQPSPPSVGYAMGMQLFLYVDGLPSIGGTWKTSGGRFTITSNSGTASTTCDETFNLADGGLEVQKANVTLRGISTVTGLRVMTGGTISVAQQHLDVQLLQVFNGGRFNLGTGGHVLRSPDVGIQSGGTLDLGDGLFIDGNVPSYGTGYIPTHPTPSPATSPAYLDALRATNGTSTLTVRVDAAASTNAAQAVGWGKGATLLQSYPSGTFAGEAIDADDFVFRATVRGDTDLDRDVDFADLLTIAKNYDTTGKTPAQGNVDGSTDGSVNFADLLILAKSYHKTFTPAAPTVATASPTRKNRAMTLEI